MTTRFEQYLSDPEVADAVTALQHNTFDTEDPVQQQQFLNAIRVLLNKGYKEGHEAGAADLMRKIAKLRSDAPLEGVEQLDRRNFALIEKLGEHITEHPLAPLAEDIGELDLGYWRPFVNAGIHTVADLLALSEEQALKILGNDEARMDHIMARLERFGYKLKDGYATLNRDSVAL